MPGFGLLSRLRQDLGTLHQPLEHRTEPRISVRAEPTAPHLPWISALPRALRPVPKDVFRDIAGLPGSRYNAGITVGLWCNW